MENSFWFWFVCGCAVYHYGRKAMEHAFSHGQIVHYTVVPTARKVSHLFLSFLTAFFFAVGFVVLSDWKITYAIILASIILLVTFDFLSYILAKIPGMRKSII